MQQKRYRSQYLTFDVRARLIGVLEQEHEPCLKTTTSVRLSPDAEGGSVACEIEGDGRGRLVRAQRGVVFAAGRHGPISYGSMPGLLPTVFRQVELGVRIEQMSCDFFLRAQPDLDPKLLVELSPVAGCRTFCCCREGEAVATQTAAGVLSLSGRADVGVTGRSNVGFNVRTTDETLGNQIWREYLGIEQPVKVRETEWMGGRELLSAETMADVLSWVGPSAASMLLQGFRYLLDAFPGLESGRVRLLGPCIEGVGMYPAIDRSLRVAPYRLWVAGDATGIFRGLTASFVSGYYAGLCASREVPHGP